MKTSLILAFASLILMLIGYYCSRFRVLHISIMATVICIDIAMPFYLFQIGDWKKRLIDQEEIFSFLIWMHVGLVLCIYILFAAQVATAFKIVQAQTDVRTVHRMQGRAAILVKLLIVLTGAILIK